MSKFSLDTAKELIDFCIQSFQPLDEVDVSQFGFEMSHYFEDKKTNTQVFIAKDKGRIIVCFRGTDSKQDIYTELKIKKVKFPPMKRLIFKSRIHKGFLTSYYSIDGQIRAALSSLLDQSPYTIYFTGYSLGGALAHIAALDIQTKLRLPVSVYSFGAPRIGNRWWRKHYNSKMKNSYRIVNDDDLIPSLPSKTAGYVHIDTSCIIDEENTLFVNPSNKKLLEKNIEGWTSILNGEMKEHKPTKYKEKLSKVEDVLEEVLDNTNN